MITKAEKEQIQEVIGFRYVKPIQEHLNSQGHLNKDGKQHSRRMITNVMNGAKHAVIEQAIFQVVAIKKEEIKRRKQILKRR
ncbi:hypothetical protein G1K66_08395 [Tenacibaculum finnmarkense]|uniref:hypothetical protein n=1 Tax=Tenacibaculum finnmarkense TaxID=2781243 RepID=UPI001EFB048C|nr:hypothetical protein [Tenacibaculum finnmarkense]MCG8813279.1 hypothetical protein [Tenacibaculum finnmarkense]